MTMGIVDAVSSLEFWFGATTALAFEEVVRAGLRSRLASVIGAEGGKEKEGNNDK